MIVSHEASIQWTQPVATAQRRQGPSAELPAAATSIPPGVTESDRMASEKLPVGFPVFQSAECRASEHSDKPESGRLARPQDHHGGQ